MYSDNVDYANNFSVNISSWWYARGIEIDFSNSGGNAFSLTGDGDWSSADHSRGAGVKVNFNYNTGPINSWNETRVKSKFFSLLIYAGYPA